MRIPSYDYHALDTWRRCGVRRIEFWCTGTQANGHICTNRNTVDIVVLIERHGPGTSLVMLARRMRCQVCGHRGGHVQPAPPPASGTPHYHEWLRGELERCTAFLAAYGKGK